MSAPYEVDPGASFKRVDNGWGWIYLCYILVIKTIEIFSRG